MADAPRPTTDYVVVPPGWDPRTEPWHGWRRKPKQVALQEQADWEAFCPVGPPLVVLRVDSTYTLVDGDDD